MIFNWLIVGTDAHAKNYSLLLNGPDFVLAPLYDLVSLLPHDARATTHKLAMSISGEYRLDQIVGHHWARFAQANDLGSEIILDRARHLTSSVADAFTAARDELGSLEASALPAQLQASIAANAKKCLKALDN